MVSCIIRLFTKNTDEKQKRKITGYICSGFGVLLNTLLFIFKFIAGAVSGAVSITADGFNNLSDAVSSLFSLTALFISNKKADRNHPFGHGRVEYLTGTLVSVAIILTGFEVMQASFHRILHPEKTELTLFTLGVLIISLIIKLYMALYNKKWGKKIDSSPLIASYKDSISDFFLTFFIIISVLISYFTDYNIESYAALIMSLFIIKAGIESLIESSSPLLGACPDENFIKRIEEIVFSSDEFLGMHDLVVHNYGPYKNFVSFHAELDGSRNLFELHELVDSVERKIREELSCEVVIHMDPVDVSDSELEELCVLIKSETGKISPSVKAHDIRLIRGENNTNVIFELAFLPSSDTDPEKLKKILTEKIREKNENYVVIIRTETSYS